MCRDLCIFDAAWGGVELWKRCMTYLESHGIQTSRHGTKKEENLSLTFCLCVWHSDVFRVCAPLCTFFLLPAGVNEQGLSHGRTYIKYGVTRACFHCLNFSLYFALKYVSCFIGWSLVQAIQPVLFKSLCNKSLLTSCNTSAHNLLRWHLAGCRQVHTHTHTHTGLTTASSSVPI